MDNWETRVQLSRRKLHWIEVRESYVRALQACLHCKPIVRDEIEFLKRLLDTIHGVMTWSENSVLFCMILWEKNWYKIKMENSVIEGRIIGGMMLMPSLTLKERKYVQYEDFIEVSKKFRSTKFDNKWLDCPDRYEEQEYKNLTRHLFESEVPKCKRTFCVTYSSHDPSGLPATHYVIFPRQLKHFCSKITEKDVNSSRLKCAKSNDKRSECRSIGKTDINPERTGFFAKLCHAFTLLHHRPRVLPRFRNKHFELSGIKRV
ncbi:uncharacterized protein LOC120340764 [Styela clava]